MAVDCFADCCCQLSIAGVLKQTEKEKRLKEEKGQVVSLKMSECQLAFLEEKKEMRATLRHVALSLLRPLVLFLFVSFSSFFALSYTYLDFIFPPCLASQAKLLALILFFCWPSVCCDVACCFRAFAARFCGHLSISSPPLGRCAVSF